MSVFQRLGVLALLCPAAAWAQPDPFEAYDAARKPAPAAQPEAPAPAPAPKRAAPKPVIGIGEGALLIGGGAVFNYSTASNELPDGDEASNSTLFMRLNPAINYFVSDSFEVGLTPGVLVRQLDRGGSDTTTDSALLLSVTGRYFHHLTGTFSLYAGGAIGGAYGGSNRGLTIMDDTGREREVTEETTTTAFMLGGDVGAAYMVQSNLQLRASLDLTWLTGSESITSLDKDLAVSTVNTGLGIALFGVF
jgi:opacity protein-like surface antigen